MRLANVREEKLPHRKRRRVGRGAATGQGCTAGRGTKGHHARSGSGGILGYEGGQTALYRRLPKRGFKNFDFKTVYEIVNVEQLGQFAAGSAIGPDELRAARLIRGRGIPVKILGQGEISVALKVSAHAFSASAAEKIKAAGGEINAI